MTEKPKVPPDPILLLREQRSWRSRDDVTLRDLFALTTLHAWVVGNFSRNIGSVDASVAADDAYVIADAMLKRRAKS